MIPSSEWTKSSLGECFRIKHGWAFKGEFFSDSGPFVLLTPGNFREDGGLQAREEREKFYVGQFPSDFLLKRGELLIVMTDLTQNAPILGSPAIVPCDDKYLHNQRLGKVIHLDESKLRKLFLYHLLNSRNVREQIKATATGATVKHTAPERIYSVRVMLPPIHIQERIASILSAYDDLIENNLRRIAILDEMATMIYREWFVNFRFPDRERVRMVRSDVGRTPSGWTTEPLENVCVRITDGSHWSPTTVRSTHRMASSKDMRRWGLDISECRTISKEDYDSLVRNDCRPLAGDILITKDGANYLKYCFAVEKNLDVVLLSSIAMLRPQEQVLSTYLSFYLRDPAVKARLSGRVSGVAIPRIVLADFRRFKIMLPDRATLRDFHKVVDPMVKLCCHLTECNRNLRQARHLLLPKLISGEVNVENLNTEAVAQGV